jgi:predicted RND superfamily exporter protein
MTKFTISIFRFFQKHPVLFYAVLILSSLFFFYFGSKVEYEEDISKLLPSTESGGSEKVVFANLKVKDKLFILFRSENDSIGPDELAAVCDSFVSVLLARDIAQKQPVIEDALYKIEDDFLQNSIRFLYNHIPLFLDSADYMKMDSILTKENIENQMSDNFMTLLSPAGMAFRDLIMKDPVAFRTIFMGKMEEMKEGLGANFIIRDGYFFTPDTVIGLAFISPNFQSFNSKESIKLVEMLEEEIEQFESVHSEIKISYHGAPAQSVYNSRQIKKDLAVTLTISLLIICSIILYCFRNKSSLVYLLVPVIYGTFFSLTVIYFYKGTMSLQAMGIGAVVLGVTLSYCLHVLTHYKYVSDPIQVLKDQTVPLILGSLTTIGAFAALLFTQSDLLKDFGIFASLALIGTTFFCLIFLPHFFNPEKNRRSDRAFAFLEKINSYPLERQTKLIIGIVVLSGICFYTSRWVTFDADLKNIGYHEKKVVESHDLLIAHTTPGYETTYYAATSRNLDTALISGRQMAQVLDTLLQEKKICSFSHPSSLFIPTSEQQERIDRWNVYWSKERKIQVERDIIHAGAAYNFKPELFQSFFDALNKTYQPVDIYNSGVIPSAILANMIEYTDSTYIVFTSVQLKKENQADVSNTVAKSKNAVVIDPFFYTKDMVSLLKDDFDLILGISSVFVFIVLLVSYRSVVLSVLGFIPMALSWYIVLGIMGIFGMQFNLINIIISTFIFGIGVDYSIFVMDGLLAGFRTRYQLLMYHKTAIFLSALVLVIGIASLMFAVHPAISSIGLSTLIGMSTAVLIAYSLQPFLFYWLIKRLALNGKAPVTVYNLLHAEACFGKKGFSGIQKLRNNYAYKGISIENSLRKELKKTSGYAVFEPFIKDNERVLDYGCGYGFTTYWFMLKSTKSCVTGYDSDTHAIAIADNCYLKNERIHFVSDKNLLLNETYDVLVLNKAADLDKEDLLPVISKAHTVIFRAEVFSLIKEMMPSGFSEVEDGNSIFRIFVKGNKE